MNIQKDVSLLPYNTFQLNEKAATFAEFTSVRELREILQSKPASITLLGGGSNVLISGTVNGLVLKNSIKGIKVLRRFAHKVWVEVNGGERWHDFVLWAVANNYGGIENMSLIPGTVGASPIQNIGAYGVEIKDVFVRLKAVSLMDGRVKTFSHKACRFGYRDSVFKREEKGKWCITSVVFSLSTGKHRIRTSYGDITKTLADNGVTQPTIADVSKAVIQIRTSKLPDPSVLGNSGSFFKNPEVSADIVAKIAEKHPQMPRFPLDSGLVKVPAGWLIEQCGWKGKRVGNTGSYEKQALVLVNYGGATGQEVWQLAQDIIRSVKEQFGITLEPEVNVL